ncbi:MAG: Ig-like domain-containing protein [Candidatus Diapherotrites archaeon]
MKKNIAFAIISFVLILLTAFVSAAPADLNISINSGATYANNAAVTLTLSATDANQCQYSNDGTTFSGYEAYAATKNWNLSAGDGNKTVYYQCRDSNGMETAAKDANDSIILDATPPSGLAISINDGNATARNANVKLTLSATGATECHYSNDGTTFSAYEAYATTKTWDLSAGDGSKTVYYQCKDTAGNETSAAGASDSITLDSGGPTVSANAPTGSTNDNTPTISFNVTDAGSGVDSTKIAVKVDGSAVTPVIVPVSGGFSVSYTPVAAIADKTVSVSVDTNDLLGNHTAFSWTFDIDTSAPTGLSISINGGDSYTRSTGVTLSLSASGASQCRYSNDTTQTSSYESYVTSKSWNLSGGDGGKTVYFQCKDAAGNETSMSGASDSITLDSGSPSQPTLDSANTISDSEISLSWGSVSDNSSGSGLKEYRIYRSNSSDSGYSNVATTTSTSYTHSGLSSGTTYYFKVSALDNAGNESAQSNYRSATTSGSSSDNSSNDNSSDNSDDETAPTLSWSSPLNNATVSGVVLLKVSAADASGIAQITFYLDDEILGNVTSKTGSYYQYELELSNVSEGTHKLKARAGDNASPRNYAYREISVKVTNANLSEDALAYLNEAKDKKAEIELLIDTASNYGVELISSIKQWKEFGDANLLNAEVAFDANKFADCNAEAESAEQSYEKVLESLQCTEEDKERTVMARSVLLDEIASMNLSAENAADITALLEENDIERELMVVKIVNGNESYYKVVGKITFSNNSDSLLRLQLIEIIPKEFAESASEIESGARFSILNEDPILKWSVSVAAGEKVEVFYSIDKKFSLGDAQQLITAEFESIPLVFKSGATISLDELAKKQGGSDALAGAGAATGFLGLGNIELPSIELNAFTFFIIVVVLLVVIASLLSYLRMDGGSSGSSGLGSKGSKDSYHPLGMDRGGSNFADAVKGWLSSSRNGSSQGKKSDPKWGFKS